MIWGYQDILGPKNCTRKIDKIHKDFELYHVFMHKFWTKMFGYSHYIFCLQEESTHFGLTVLTNFGLEIQDILGPKNAARNVEKIPNDF